MAAFARRLCPALALALGLPLAGQAQESTPPTLALAIGTVHPVSGPAYQDGILLIGGGRILAAGPRASVPVPPGIEMLSFPTGHAYPGLIDAASHAYLSGVIADTDAGTEVLGALDPFARGADAVAAGITTAQVSPVSTGAWRGIGALVRPRAEGFAPFGADARGAADLDLVAAAGTHPLARAKGLADLGRPFEEVEGYRKQHDKYKDALAKYEKDFKAYLAALEKKNPNRAANGQDADPQAANPQQRRGGGAPGSEGGSGRRGGGEGRPRGEGEGTGRPRGGDTPPGEGAPRTRPEGAPASGGATAGSGAGGGGTAGAAEPKKPTFPKPPSVDTAKEALEQIVKGDLRLRITAQREDEIRAALALIDEQHIRHVALLGGAQAGGLAEELARRGIGVVLTPTGAALDVDGEPVPDTLAADLHRAGVPVVIGSGDVERSRFLPLLAALCAGGGLPEDAAVRAITLTAAEVLGIADRTGSLDVGKRADILVTSAPLLSSEARVLRVLADGETVSQGR